MSTKWWHKQEPKQPKQQSRCLCNPSVDLPEPSQRPLPGWFMVQHIPKKPSNSSSSTTRRERALTSPPTDTSPSPTPPQHPQPHTPPQPHPKSSPASPQQHTNSARPSPPGQPHHPKRPRNPSRSPSRPTPPLSRYAHGCPRSRPRRPRARPRRHDRRFSAGSTSARRGGGATAGAGWLVWRCSCSGRC